MRRERMLNQGGIGPGRPGGKVGATINLRRLTCPAGVVS